MPSRLSLIAALLLPLAVQAEPADTRALLADSLADSQAQVEAAEQAMRRSENKAVQLYAKRVLTEQQEFDHQLRALAGEKALALPSPRQTERQAAAPGGFDERFPRRADSPAGPSGCTLRGNRPGLRRS